MYLPETISGPTKRSYLKTINNARNGGSTNFVFSGQIGSRCADVAKYMVNATGPYSAQVINTRVSTYKNDVNWLLPQGQTAMQSRSFQVTFQNFQLPLSPSNCCL